MQGVGSGARLLRNAFSFDGSEGTGVPGHAPENDVQPPRSSGIFGRGPKREVVPGLPRQQTFKRQQSELRDNLLPTTESTAERRTVSVDRRIREASRNGSHVRPFPRASAPDLFLNGEYDLSASLESIPHSPIENLSMDGIQHIRSPVSDEPQDYESSLADDQSMTSSQYESNLRHELESIWILNLSMHFRDRSKREKFFVTYRQLGPHGEIWRRVTVSLDYRDAPEGSLEWELVRTRFQREKSAKIYDAIRESLSDIQFYDTVTNLKLQTTDGRLHVHVVEDVNVSSCRARLHGASMPWRCHAVVCVGLCSDGGLRKSFNIHQRG